MNSLQIVMMTNDAQTTIVVDTINADTTIGFGNSLDYSVAQSETAMRHFVFFRDVSSLVSLLNFVLVLIVHSVILSVVC